jgi:hypothetical protein
LKKEEEKKIKKEDGNIWSDICTCISISSSLPPSTTPFTV